MVTVYTQVPQEVVIDIVRSLGWLTQVRYASADNAFTRIYFETESGRRGVAWLMTYVVHIEVPCQDIVASIEQGNNWNRIHGGPAVLYRDNGGTMVLRIGFDVDGGITRECMRVHFMTLEYDLTTSIPNT